MKLFVYYLTLASVFELTIGALFMNCTRDDFNRLSVLFDCATLERNDTLVTSFDNEFNQYLNNRVIVNNNCYGRHAGPVTNSHRLKFVNCELPVFPYEFFTNRHQTEEIYLDHSNIVTIANGKSLVCNNLKILSMANNKINKLPASLFSENPQIEMVDFSHNKIEKIDPKAIDGAAKSIKVINLAHNFIKELSFLDALELSELTDINLSHNQLETLQLEFLNAKNLRIFNVSSNNFVRLDCDSFFGSTATEISMDFASNKIKEIDLNCDKHVERFLLYVEDNLLEDLTFPTSRLMDGLVTFDASGNKIEKISVQGGLEKLKTLVVDENRLSDVSDIFKYGTSLETLSLSRNKISEITIEKELKNLTYLEIEDNGLTNISDIFKNCHSLEFLDLSFNNIGNLDVNSFVKLENLGQLNLSHTSLWKIDYGLFSHSHNLNNLDLSGNNLNSFNFDVFLPRLENLHHLYLHDNSLTRLDGWTNEILPNLTILAISNNNFNCNYLAQFIKTISLKKLQLQPDATILAHDDKRKNIKKITCIDENDSFDDIELVNDDKERTERAGSIKDGETHIHYHHDSDTLHTIKYLLACLCIVCFVIIVMIFLKFFKPNCTSRYNAINRSIFRFQRHETQNDQLVSQLSLAYVESKE